MTIKSGKTETKTSGIFTKLQLCNACLLSEMLVSPLKLLANFILAKMCNRRIPRTLSTLHSDITIFCLHCLAVSVLWRCIMVKVWSFLLSRFGFLLFIHNSESRKENIGLENAREKCKLCKKLPCKTSPSPYLYFLSCI